VIPRGRSAAILGARSSERRNETRAQLGVSTDTTLVIAAARHEFPKGLDLYVRACKILMEIRPGRYRFIVGGRDGLRTPELHQLARDLGLSEEIDFIGQRDDVADLMAAADLWCVPSRWEGLGSILIEAMALEVTVVATNIPAIIEVAGNPPVFWLATPESPQDLAEKMRNALDDPERSREMTTNGRQRFLDRFTIERVADETVRLYLDARAVSRWRWLRKRPLDTSRPF
jgi:glycosyltransferase involved in cell wall biosynthesis